MAGITTKSFNSPDETRTPPEARVEVVRLGEVFVLEILSHPRRPLVIGLGHYVNDRPTADSS